jgi:hypothetical protein
MFTLKRRPIVAEDIRRCIHCGGRQKIEEGLQRDLDGVIEERIGLQVAMREAIDHLNRVEPMSAVRVLEDALAVLDVVVENHPKPEPVVTPLPEGYLAWPMTHIPCCSSHGVKMTCPDYKRTHFVEVGNCCSWWAENVAPVSSRAGDS